MNQPNVIVVMPAYNAAKTLERTYDALPKDVVREVILVDDGSRDDTVAIARRLGLKVFVHSHNRGYGGNQKTCYLEALKDGADVVVMLHPDYQYDAGRVPQLIAPILAGTADFTLGSRLLDGGALAGGMPRYKYLSNRFLTIVENIAFRQNLSECHTGLRAYSRRFLETIPFLLNSEKFVFDTEVIAEAVAFGFQMGEIPVPTRYFAEASSVNWRGGIVYGLSTLGVVASYLLHRAGIRRDPRFHRRLEDILSPEVASQVLRGGQSPGWSPTT